MISRDMRRYYVDLVCYTALKPKVSIHNAPPNLEMSRHRMYVANVRTKTVAVAYQRKHNCANYIVEITSWFSNADPSWPPVWADTSGSSLLRCIWDSRL